MNKEYNIFQNDRVRVDCDTYFDYNINKKRILFTFYFNSIQVIDGIYCSGIWFEANDYGYLQIDNLNDLFVFLKNNELDLESSHYWNCQSNIINELKEYFKMELNPAKTILERIKNG